MKQHKIETKIVELYFNKRINLLQKDVLLKNIHTFLPIYQKLYEKSVIEKSKIDGIIIDDVIDDVIDEMIMAALEAISRKLNNLIMQSL